MTTTINAVASTGLVQTSDGSGVIKVQSNGVTTNALAWVNFNGTTSPGTIRSQYNVSSVTKNSTGNYTLNFASNLSDANYVVVGGGSFRDSGAESNVGVLSIVRSTSGVLSTSGCQIACSFTGSVPAVSDLTYVYVAVFGN